MPGRVDLVDAFAGIADRATMERFFAEIFTPAERRTLALRWRLMELLVAGVSQREIAVRLGVSLCKITRGSRILKGRRSVARSLLAARPRTGRGRSKRT